MLVRSQINIERMDDETLIAEESEVHTKINDGLLNFAVMDYHFDLTKEISKRGLEIVKVDCN